MTTSYKRITESIEDLLGKSHYMIVKSQMDGNLTFDGHAKTVEETDNESRCRSLCARIERALESCREEEIPELLEMYDLLHRIGHGRAADQRFLAIHRNRVYTAWRLGNRDIQESQIYRLLKKSISANKITDSTKRANARALLSHILRNWVRTLCEHSYFPNVTANENYQRLALTMRENLDKELGYEGEEMKYKWYEQNRVEDLSTFGSQLLKSYRRFVNSLFPHVLDYDEAAELDNHILTELTTCSDLNRYDRQAFTMTLEYNKEMV